MLEFVLLPQTRLLLQKESAILSKYSLNIGNYAKKHTFVIYIYSFMKNPMF